MNNLRLVIYFIALVAGIFLICATGYFWSGADGSNKSVAWIVIGVFSLLLLLGIFGVITYQRLPLLKDLEQQDRQFWSSMPATSQDVLGVLYDEQRFGPVIAPAWISIRRLVVTVRYLNPDSDRVVFRATENPNKEHLDDTIRGFSTWIRTAKRYGVPAVYRTKQGLHVLSDRHFREIDADPVGFVSEFQRHLRNGIPVSAPRDSSIS